MAETIGEVIAAIAGIAPFEKAAGWDAVGLQIGDPDAPAGSVAVCHEVTDEVVGHLEASPVDLLVSYHALLHRPASALRPGPHPAGRAFRLIRAGMGLAVVHTAFDVAPGGAADALAEALQLADVEGFGPLWGADSVKVVTFAPEDDIEAVAAAMAAAGAGKIGNYSGCSFRSAGTGAFTASAGTTPAVGTAGERNRQPETRLEMIAPRSAVDAVIAALVAAHPYEEAAFDVIETASNAGFVGRYGVLDRPRALEDVAARVHEALGGVLRVAKANDDPVVRVAVVPGSGSSLLAGVPSDGDVLVTGDVTHHRAREAMDRGISIIDPGHVASERPGVARLVAALRVVRPDTIDLTDLDPSPWRAR